MDIKNKNSVRNDKNLTFLDSKNENERLEEQKEENRNNLPTRS